MMGGGELSDPGSDGEDERLLLASRTDAEAFGRFYDRRYRRVLGFFYRRTFCLPTSAELTAETFTRAWQLRERFEPETGTGMGWLMGIAGNLYRNWLRRGVVSDRARRRWGLSVPDLAEEDYEHVEALVDIASLRVNLQAALETLSPGMRDAVLLRVAQDLPYEEVAHRLKCTPGAARVRVSRALEQLYTALEAQP